MYRNLFVPTIIKLLSVAGLLFAGVVNGGEIYKWTDKNGVVHFGDTPPATAVYSVPEIEINSYSAALLNDQTAGSGGKVLMYGTSWCGYCKKARKYFAKEGISFKEYDIEKSPSARRRYDELNGKGVPLIVVGYQRLSGFSVEAFERIYK